MNRLNEVLLYNAITALTLHRNIVRIVALKHFYQNFSVPAIYYTQHVCDACLLFGYPPFYDSQTTPAMCNLQYHPDYLVPPENFTAAPVSNPQCDIISNAVSAGNQEQNWNNNVASMNDTGRYWPPRKPSVLWSPDNDNAVDCEGLDLTAIHRESQQYNDCSLLHEKLDYFFATAVLKRVASYAADSYHKLTESQINVLRSIVIEGKSSATVFDQLSWFGYDALVTSEQDDTLKTLEYLKILKEFAGISLKNLEQTRISMAIDFAINFKLSDAVIAACDEHFERAPRKRMAYTKMFTK